MGSNLHKIYFWIVSTTIAITAIINVSQANTKSSKTYSCLNQGLRFTENKGQEDKNILYVGDLGSGTMIYFQNGKLSYVMSKTEGREEKKEHKKQGYDPVKERQEKLKRAAIKMDRVDLEFENCNPNTTIVAENQAKDYANYYLLQCKNGVT